MISVNFVFLPVVKNDLFEHKFLELCLARETNKMHTYLLWKDRPNLTNFNLTKLFLKYQRESSSKTSFQLTDLSNCIRNQSDLVSMTHRQGFYAKPSQAEKGDNGSLVNVCQNATAPQVH